MYMLFNFQRSTKAIFLPPKYMQTLLESKKFFRQPWKKYFERNPPLPTFNVGKVVEVGTWGKMHVCPNIVQGGGGTSEIF